MFPESSFHHGTISRLKAEQILIAAKDDGSFLVRRSETVPDAHVLCLLYKGKVHKYQILTNTDRTLYIQAHIGVEYRTFSNISELISRYIDVGANNGLCCALVASVPASSGQSTGQVKGQVGGLVGDQVKDQVKGQVTSQVGGQVTSQVGGQVKGQVGGQVTSHVGGKVKGQVGGQVTSQVGGQVKGQVGGQVTSHVGGKVKGQVGGQVTSQVGGQVKGQAGGQNEGHGQTGGQAASHEYDDDDSSEDEFGLDIPVRSEEEAVKARKVMNLSTFFCQQFTQLDLSSTDGQFVNALRIYAEKGVRTDADRVTSGDSELSCLRKLLGGAAADLEREMEVFLSKVDLCRQLFGPLTTPAYVPKKDSISRKEKSSDLTAILERFTQCQTAISHLEKKAQVILQDLMTNSAKCLLSTSDDSPFTMNYSTPPVIPPVDFESRLLKHGKATQRMKLTVDIQSGRLYVVKPNTGVLNESSVFTHNRILQLVKNLTNKSQLDILFEGCKKESHVFEDMRQRETFCQLVQQLKNHHSKSKQLDQLSVFIGTWNMGDATPSTWNLGPWLKCSGKGKPRSDVLQILAHDLYVVGTQETGIGEKDWVVCLKTMLHTSYGIEMHTVATVTLWGISLVVLVKAEYMNNISHVQQSTVKTGLANALGNKGAVGLSFDFNATSFCFVCAHLAARQERVNKRNQNFVDTIKGMNLGPKDLSVFDITNKFHHVFYFGDLNYRLEDIQATEVIKQVSQGDNYMTLLEHDQLQRAQHNKQAFVGFSEEEITFPPTYRFEIGSRTKYAWQKFKKTGTRINTPSWCDRVMWRSYRDTYISNTSYGCTDNVVTSDHKPVFASFDVGILGQFVPDKGTPAQPGDKEIIFVDVTTQLKTSIRENVMIEFHSACLEGATLSKPTGEIAVQPKGQYSASWGQLELPKMQPIFDDIEYLDDQHLLLAVRGADSLDSYGECVLPLKSRLSVWPQSFEVTLMHHGEVTGCIRGKMHVKSKQGTLSPFKSRGRRSYELIYTEPPSQPPKQPTSLRSTLPKGALFDETTKRGSLPSPVKTRPPTVIPRKISSSSIEYTEVITLPKLMSHDQGADRPPSPVEYMTVAAPPSDDRVMVDNELYDGITRRPISTHLTPSMSQCRRVAHLFNNGSIKNEGDSGSTQQQPPSTVREWLSELHMDQYVQVFLEQGWDHLDFLHLLSDSDLENLGVNDPAHRKAILNRIGQMKT